VRLAISRACSKLAVPHNLLGLTHACSLSGHSFQQVVPLLCPDIMCAHASPFADRYSCVYVCASVCTPACAAASKFVPTLCLNIMCCVSTWESVCWSLFVLLHVQLRASLCPRSALTLCVVCPRGSLFAGHYLCSCLCSCGHLCAHTPGWGGRREASGQNCEVSHRCLLSWKRWGTLLLFLLLHVFKLEEMGGSPPFSFTAKEYAIRFTFCALQCLFRNQCVLCILRSSYE